MATFKMIIPDDGDTFDPNLPCVELIDTSGINSDNPSFERLSLLLEKATDCQESSEYLGISLGNCLVSLAFETSGHAPKFTAHDVISGNTLNELGYRESGTSPIPASADIIVPHKSSWINNFCMSDVESHVMWYWWHRRANDLALLREIIESHYPDFESDIEEYERAQASYPLGTFIMKKEAFREFAGWAASILDQHPCSTKSYTDLPWPESFEPRIVFSHLLGIFAKHHARAKGEGAVLNAPCAYFDNLSNPYLKPAFEHNNIAVVFASDSEYAPLASVAIESVISNASRDKNYDIILLDAGLTNADRVLIKHQTQDRENISVRFVKLGKDTLDRDLPTHAHIKTSAYSRFYILKYLTAYQKVVYLDCDLVCNRDISKLYETDVSNVYLAAVRDSANGGWINIVDNDTREYIRDVIRLEKIDDYFNSGVLVLNVEMLSKATSSERLIELAKSTPWRWEDQDVLNYFASGKVKYIDPSWNFMAHKESYFTPQLLPEMWLTSVEQNKYRKAHNNPGIVHYVGRSTPCFEPYADLAWLFWKHAQYSPYYEILCAKATESLKSTPLQPSRRPSINLKFGPLVSIIMPVYNAAPYLEKSIGSLLNQSYRNIEVICINDGSSDNSLDILQRLTSEDHRVTVIDKPNSGAGDTRNTGMKHVCGKYMCFVDSDDFVEPNMIERLVDAAESSNADAVVFGLDTYDHVSSKFIPNDYAVVDGKIPSKEVFYAANVDNFYKYLVGFTVNKLYRTSFLLGLDLFFPKIGAHEDLPFTYLALSASKRTYYLDETLYHYRRSREGSLSDTTSNHYRFMFEALDCLRDELVKHDLWSDYERNFSNYALHMMVWKYEELNRVRKLEFKDSCRKKWVEHFNLMDRETGYFFDQECLDFLTHTINLPLSRRIAASIIRKMI